MAYKCSETEGWEQEERERVWKGEMQTNRKRRADWMNRRGGGRDSKINLSYFEFEYVVLQIETSGKPSKQLRAVSNTCINRCGLGIESCLKFFSYNINHNPTF